MKHLRRIAKGGIALAGIGIGVFLIGRLLTFATEHPYTVGISFSVVIFLGFAYFFGAFLEL